MNQPIDTTEMTAVKSCCADLYQSDLARLLLGDSFHPGGLLLTERLGELLDLRPGQRVLDVATGQGTSAIFLAQRFGCEVVGVDYGAGSVEAASLRADLAGVSDLVRFERGDAEQLRFADQSFDAIICECAFCTFLNKAAAAQEFFRLLRPGGRAGLSDLTRSGPLPPELEGLLAWTACIADARPIEEYSFCLESAGLTIQRIELRNAALREMVREIRTKLLGAEVLVKLKKLTLPPGLDLEQAKIMAEHAAEAVRQGKLGYALLTGLKR